LIENYKATVIGAVEGIEEIEIREGMVYLSFVDGRIYRARASVFEEI